MAQERCGMLEAKADAGAWSGETKAPTNDNVANNQPGSPTPLSSET
jgi:hypothetical protein